MPKSEFGMPKKYQLPEICRASVSDANHSEPRFYRTKPRGRKRPRRAGRRPSERERTSQTPYNYFSLLRRYAIRERVGVKIGVVTQTVPGTVLFVRLRDAVFLTGCKIIPRIVPSDGEERPIGAFQMLHQYVAGSRVICRAWQFAKHFFQLLPMPGSRAIIRDRVNRARRFRFRVRVNAHGSREFFP